MTEWDQLCSDHITELLKYVKETTAFFANSKNLLRQGTMYVFVSQKVCLRSLLEVQWKRLCLPMQEARVQSLLWEDFTCGMQIN